MLPVLLMSTLLAQDAAPLTAAPVSPVPQVSAPASAPVVQTPAPAPVAAPQVPVESSPAKPSPDQPSPAKPTMVKVDAYHETPRDSTDSGIWSAFNARQSESGSMEGTWVVAATDGRKLVGFELRADAPERQLQGAWRSLTSDVGLTRSGFISDLFLDGPALEINYSTGKLHTPSVLELRKGADGQWRGVLLDPAGRKTEVTMSQSVHKS
jgi:hypothetical protein